LLYERPEKIARHCDLETLKSEIAKALA